MIAHHRSTVSDLLRYWHRYQPGPLQTDPRVHPFGSVKNIAIAQRINPAIKTKRIGVHARNRHPGQPINTQKCKTLLEF